MRPTFYALATHKLHFLEVCLRDNTFYTELSLLCYYCVELALKSVLELVEPEADRFLETKSLDYVNQRLRKNHVDLGIDLNLLISLQLIYVTSQTPTSSYRIIDKEEFEKFLKFTYTVISRVNDWRIYMDLPAEAFECPLTY